MLNPRVPYSHRDDRIKFELTMRWFFLILGVTCIVLALTVFRFNAGLLVTGTGMVLHEILRRPDHARVSRHLTIRD